MLKLRKSVVIGAMILAIGGTALTAFAASGYGTPAEAAAGLTGRTIESVAAERAETGKTYGAIAEEAGKLDTFKAEVLEMKKEALAERVAAGTISQKEADEIITALEARQAACDGTGSARIGQKFGAGFGSMAGGKDRDGSNDGLGLRGAGGGFGNCRGICRAQ